MEVLLSMLMTVLLATATWPRLQDQALRARRADAWSSLAALELAQERHRMDKGRYAIDIAELGVGSTSAAGHYGVGVAFGDGTGYRLVAQARGDSVQGADTPCLNLAVERSGSHVHRLAGPSIDALVVDVNRQCWPR